MSALLAALVHDPGQLRARAEDLLSRPPYHDEPDGPVARLIATVRQWVAEALDRVLATVAGDAWLAWLVVAAGVAVLLLVVWRTTRGLTLDRAVEAPASGAGRGRPAAEWHAAADDHEAAARWTEAIRCRYVALTTRLVELGIVEEVPGRTVGELDRELAEVLPAVAEQAGAAGQLFAEVVYGRRRPGGEQARRLRELTRAVERGAGAGAPAHGPRVEAGSR